MSDTLKPLLVGESNPYGGDDYYALYPAPDGCSGHRLCCLILGMHRVDYLEAFERVNLCRGPWRIRDARTKAAELLAVEERKVVLFGSKVCAAAGVVYEPFAVRRAMRNGEREVLVLPHPSGLCRLWGTPGAMERARLIAADYMPDLAHLFGMAKR